MERNYTDAWKDCLAIIRDNIEKQSYQTWFEPVKALALKDDVLTIQVPSVFFYEHLEQEYVSLIKKTIKRVIGINAKLNYNIPVDNSAQHPTSTVLPSQRTNKALHNQKINEPIAINRDIKNPFILPGLKQIDFFSQLNPTQTFENYVEGECNRLARSAGLAISEKPGATMFNPLMIFGNSGLGKTHLVNSIGNEIKERFPEKAVVYVTCHQFVEQFIQAVANREINSFVHFYQSMDVIVMDDIQEFENKDKSQEIFFHIFNHLHQKGKQIILTSDRAPKDLKNLQERLISRFRWGLTAEVVVPDFETRIKILRMKMFNDGIELPDDVVDYMASKIESNARDLEGALVTLMFHSTINKGAVDIAMARNVVKTFINNATKEFSIDYIKSVVCEYFEIPVDMIISKSRKREVVQARQISMYLAKGLTKSSLKSIGQHFGNLHHSTVIYALNQVEDLKDVDKKFKNDIQEVEKKLKMNH